MDIEISRDLQHYKESFVMGLTAKQFIFSALSLGAGAGVVLGLYNKIGMTLSCYLATPIVVPIALTGFYNHNGLSFWQTVRKMIKMSFFNKPCLYRSTEDVELIKEAFAEEQKLIAQQQKKEAKAHPDGKEDFRTVKKRAKRLIILTVGILTVTVAGVLAYKFMR